MVNNYDEAMRLIDEVRVKRADLIDEYAEANRREVIARLHQDVGASMKLAAIHSTLSVRDAILDAVGSLR